jgi:hypothetical protein
VKLTSYTTRSMQSIRRASRDKGSHYSIQHSHCTTIFHHRLSCDLSSQHFDTRHNDVQWFFTYNTCNASKHIKWHRKYCLSFSSPSATQTILKTLLATFKIKTRLQIKLRPEPRTTLKNIYAGAPTNPTTLTPSTGHVELPYLWA